MDGTAGWGNLTGLSKGYGKKFTLSAFDNFDHSDKSTLSGKSDSHDTVITLFQEIPDEKQKKLGKSEVNLKEIKSIEKLSCQQLVPYSTDKSLVIPETFTVQLETFASDTKKKEFKTANTVQSCIRGNIDNSKICIQSWAGSSALLTKSKLPLMQVAFLPFLPYPVTDTATVYTAMLNFSKLLNQLEQKTLPIFCDEGVFRIVLNIYLKNAEKFRDLVPMLGGFHMAK